MDKEKIQMYCNVVKRAISRIEEELQWEDGGIFEELSQQSSSPSVPQTTVPPVVDKKKEARKKHVEDLLAIEDWPPAVLHTLASTKPTEEDQINRAKAVLDNMIDRDITGVSFLDFGCGDGWIADEALKAGAKLSVGYDIEPSENWSKFNGPDFTTSFSEISKSEFDMIFLYDVLDHCEDPIELMRKVKMVSSSDSLVYIRCHPWTSKHAMHMYKDGVNKAYLHMFLNWEEISELIGHKPMFTRPETNPLEAYHWWFKGFSIKREEYIKEPVNNFFHNKSFKELLCNEQQIPSHEMNEFLKRMELQFVDFQISNK